MGWNSHQSLRGVQVQNTEMVETTEMTETLIFEIVTIYSVLLISIHFQINMEKTVSK